MKKTVHYPTKPVELSPLAQCIIEQHQSGYQRRRQAHPLRLEPQKVLVIVRFESDTPRFAVVKDRTKFYRGFPGGGVDAIDDGVVNSAVRELKEEINLSVSADQLIDIGEIQIDAERSHVIHVFTVTVPDQTIFAGVEQEYVLKLTAEEIDILIAEGTFLRNHANAWQGYKDYLFSKEI